jgi:hypothetical protein
VIVTDEMVEQAAIKSWLSGGLNTAHGWRKADSEERAKYLREARTVLEYAATLGPSRGERLARYRCACEMSRQPGDNAGRTEDRAHAMLAAERSATDVPPVLDVLKDEMIAALEKRVELLYEGIAEARTMLVANVANVDDAAERLAGLLPQETP